MVHFYYEVTHSHYAVIIERKSDLLLTIKRFKLIIERQFGFIISIYHLDNERTLRKGWDVLIRTKGRLLEYLIVRNQE